MAGHVEIDGSRGEGGGQVLRTALALSLVTGKPFHLIRIRAGRKKPGLLHQHLTSVKAAAEIGAAEVRGAELGSKELFFTPHAVRAGKYTFAIETAGSCTLVLQAVLPALLTAHGSSEIVLEGGTHNPFAPPFDFLAKAFLPVVNRMGPTVSVALGRPGFYPAGGGRMSVSIQPAPALRPLDLVERGEVLSHRARAIVARLPRAIAERELAVIARAFSWERQCLHVEEAADSRGPGNVVLIEIASERLTEVFTAFGERGIPAEQVARRVIDEAREYLDAGVPIGKHLADQLLIPMALTGSGRLRTLRPTEHTRTNCDVIREFLDLDVTIAQPAADTWEIEIRTR